MPIYEYGCDKCQKIHEVTQKISDAPLSQCPDCKGNLKKLISRTSFQLKGSGWYATDYKKSGATSAAPAPAESPTAKTSPTTPVKGGDK